MVFVTVWKGNHLTMDRALRLVLLALLGALLSAGMASLGIAYADSNSDVVKALTQRDVYVTPVHLASGDVQPGDAQRLQAAVNWAGDKGVQEKIAIISHFPRHTFPNIGQAADGLRNFLAFTGVLILVGPPGIAVSTDSLTVAERTAIAQKVRPRCFNQGYAACAAYASQLTVVKMHTDDSSTFHNTVVFWIVILVALSVFFAAIVLIVRGRRGQSNQRLGELRRAGASTLALTDTAVEQIEKYSEKMKPDVRQQYDSALGLRNRAREELDTARTERSLTAANEDAAQAVLAFQGVMRSLDIRSALSDPIDLPARRCFYCGRTDRAPYVQSTIDDGKGNSMQIEICSVDQALLARGHTPPMATVRHNGMSVPWWAVPNNPWYYSYGGSSWQYWLPFLVGMDVGGWMDGGWTGGYGDYSAAGVGAGDMTGASASQSTPNPGGADFDGWGSGPGDNSGNYGDSSGWGGDSGTDPGGADFGGGDSGGGDSGGWG